LLLENTLACLDEEVMVALNGVGLFQLTSFTIGLTYDTSVLQFEGLENIAAVFSGLTYSMETAPEPHILVSWSAAQAVNFGDGKLFDLLFTYSDGTTSLDFMSFTELINSDQAAFDLTTFSGSVAVHEYPEILIQPEDQAITDGMPAVFSVQTQGAQSYQWELSADGGANWVVLQDDDTYSGTQAAELTISSTNSAMDQNLFRCNVSGDYCGLYSNQALLTVLPEMTASFTIPAVSSCDFSAVDVPLKAAGLEAIKSLSLQISYNAELLSFIGYELLAAGLQSAAVVNHTASDAYIEINWISAQPVTIPNGSLFSFIFDYSTGGAALFELSEAEVIGQDDLPYSLILNDGQLTGYPLPQIITQPEDLFIEEGSSAQFSLEAQQTSSYQWFESRDSGNTWSKIYDLGIYQGAQTNTLLISNVPYSYNFYTYRCELKNQNCSQNSRAATLEVDPLINTNQSITEQAASHVKAIHLGSAVIKIWFHESVDHVNQLMIFDLYGNILIDHNETIEIAGGQLSLPLSFRPNSLLIGKIQTASIFGDTQTQVIKIR